MPAPPDESNASLHTLGELSGTVLEERYELGRVLGAGAMGAVFEARHLRLDRPVAIKIMRPVFAGHEMYVKRFLREAKAASKIRHRNVVEILDYGEGPGGLIYSVMEFLVGQDLEQLLLAQPEGRLSWTRACDLLVQISSGLKAAHGQGVIHRDIKPANCFLTAEDDEPVVKLVDFGIAKVDEADQTQQLTATTQVLGTPSYIAPELVRTNSPASPSSDIYSLGALAYRMLTGRVPFTADTVFEILRRACFDPVPPMRDRAPELPAAVEALVLELLGKAPADRPPNMLAVRERLLLLSHETLGAQAVDIPASSALAVDVEPAAPVALPERPPGHRPDPSREGAESPVHREPPAIVATEVQLEIVRDDPRPQASSPSTAPLLERLEGAPRQPIHDPASAPRAGETIPALGEATLRPEDVAPIERPRRKNTASFAIGIAIGLGVVGLVASSITHEDHDEPPLAKDVASVPTPANASHPPNEPTPELVTTVTSLPETVEGASTTAADEGSDDDGSEQTTSTKETDVPTSPRAEPPVVAPLEPPESLAPEPTVATPRAPAGEPQRKSQPKSVKTTHKPPVPPSDAALIREFRRLIESRCARAMNGAPLDLSFVVTPDGQVVNLTTDPKNAAGDCAAAQIEGTRFRPRTKNALKRVKVE